MTTTTEASNGQIRTILAQRYDDVARAMERDGLRLTWVQAAEIGDDGSDWLCRRLSLTVSTDSEGVSYTAAADNG